MVEDMLTPAARKGDRQMAVLGSQDEARTITRPAAKATDLDSIQFDITLAVLATDQVEVPVSAPCQWLCPGLLRNLGIPSAGTGTLSATCTMRSETS